MKLCNVPARLTLLIERSSHHFRWIVSPVFTKQRIDNFFQFSSVKLRVGKSYLYHLETKQPKCWMLWLVHTSSCNFTLQLGYLKDGNVFRFVQILYLLCVEQLRLSVAHHSYYETSLCNELLTNRAQTKSLFADSEFSKCCSFCGECVAQRWVLHPYSLVLSVSSTRRTVYIH